jgi:enoyl-[acyl-carrier-protein] reductase (NADH)
MSITVKNASERLNISVRAIQIRCKKEGLTKQGKSYLIPEKVFKKWQSEGYTTTNQTETNEAKESETITETFSQAEYDKLQEVIYHYPELIERIQDYKNEIQYLRKSLDKKTEQMDTLLHTINNSIKSIHQQNFLNAKEKGYDKE